MEIIQIAVLEDNYAYLLRDSSGQTAVVDPSEAGPVIKVLEDRGWSLNYILNTHHHWDHVGGNKELSKRYDAPVVGFAGDAHRVPSLQIQLKDGETFALGNSEARVMAIFGHTVGHIAYWFESSKAVFCGDTLFSLGCGRLFEGTAAQMWSSLSRLRELPNDTQVYCGHEYSEANARFAMSLGETNLALQARAEQIKKLRADQLPTIPSLLSDEKSANPFLRADDTSLQAALGMAGSKPVDVFAHLRQLKDQF